MNIDTGDKKAIEKTSQALREGQPKLRQKIVEMGGAAAMQAQYGHAGIDPKQVAGIGGGGGGAGPGMDPYMAAAMQQQQQQHHQHPHYQQQEEQARRASHMMDQHHAAAVAAAQAAIVREPSFRNMSTHPSPDPMKQDLHMEMFERLSLRNLNPDGGGGDHHHLQQHQQQRMRPSMTQDSQLSLASNFSAIGSDGVPNHSLQSMECSSFRRPYVAPSPSAGQQQQQQQQFSHHHPGDIPISGGSSSMSGNSGSMAYGNANNHQQQHQTPQQLYHPQSISSANQRDKLAEMDRRRVFAKMKYGAAPSSSNNPSSMPPPKSGGGMSGSSGQGGMPMMSQHSIGDGMPDIHMVESTFSLYSNMSTMSEGMTFASAASAANNNVAGGVPGRTEDKNKRVGASSGGGGQQQKEIPFRPQPESVKVEDHSRDIHWGGLGGGSKHSIMSGLSKIDDGDSMFSDLGKKNVSSRSIAMSEISLLDTNDQGLLRGRHDEEQDESDDGFEYSGTGATPRKPESAPVEYDL